MAALSSEVDGVEFAPRAVAFVSGGTLLIGSGIPENSTTSSPERARLYALGADGTLEGGPAPEGLDVSSIAVDPAGTRIAVAGRSERRVMIWDRGAGDVEDLPGAPGDLGRLAWSPDGSGPHGVSPSRGVFSFDGTAWAHCLDHLRHALVRARHRPGARSPVLRPCCSRCSRSRCGQSVWIAVAPLRTSGPHPGSGPSSSAVSSSWPR